MRFSEFYNLNKSQFELDFIDIPLDTDIPLFVDPSAISQASHDSWFAYAHNCIVNYFEDIIDDMRCGDGNLARRMLNNLNEPEGTNLGFSRGSPSGRGVGNIQAQRLYDSLISSKAVQNGDLSEISECELLIENIGADKISDITINIIKKQLIEYTQKVCQEYDVPMRNVAVNKLWHPEEKVWKNLYIELPVYNGRIVILIPKLAVRHRFTFNHRRYYNIALDYLQAEHLDAGSSLVETLKDGTRRVTKKVLKEEYPLSKEFLYDFTEEHPEALQEYKNKELRQSAAIKVDEIEAQHPEKRYENAAEITSNSIEKLQKIPSGKEHANEYHDCMIGILNGLFYPDLRNPAKEQDINDGRKRLDIMYDNSARDGFFFDLANKHGIHCPYILIECKNYSDDLSNPEIDQLIGRFSRKIGKFGIILCRTIDDKKRILKRCQDAVNSDQGYLLILSDDDVIEMLNKKGLEEFYKSEKADEVLYRKLREILT